jgi:hypothetical protein
MATRNSRGANSNRIREGSGSAIAASDGYYHDGYRRCGRVRQFDAYGNYLGRVRTCNY